jgi:hypothetical protein
MGRFTLIGVLVALVLPVAATADYKRCRPVVNIFDGTRYAGSDLYSIRARGSHARPQGAWPSRALTEASPAYRAQTGGSSSATAGGSSPGT